MSFTVQEARAAFLVFPTRLTLAAVTTFQAPELAEKTAGG